MRLLHHGGSAAQAKPAEAVSRTSTLAKSIAAGAITGALLITSPLLEGKAMAQPPPAPEAGQVQPRPPETAPPQAQPAPAPAQAEQPSEGASRVTYSVSGTTTTITDGPISRTVYAVSRQANQLPSIEVSGPARLTLWFYPAVSRERFTAPDAAVPRSVEYNTGPTGGTQAAQTYDGTTRMSNFRSAELDMAALAIGTQMEITINVPAGRHTFSIQRPNGFLEVVRVDRVEAPAARAPALPQPAPAQAQQAERPSQEAPAEEGREPNRPVFSLEGERAPLHHLGSYLNSGDIYSANAFGTYWFNDNFGLHFGGMFSSYGLAMETPWSEVSLRSYSGNLAIGVALASGQHVVTLAGFGGYRGMETSLLAIAAGNQQVDRYAHGYEVGGMAGYTYGRHLNLRVMGSNNPFNPIRGQAIGTLPFGWVSNAHPYLDVDVLWLHAMRSQETLSEVGVSSLDENNVHLRALAGIPLFRVGPVVPIAVAGGEMNAIVGGEVTGTGIFGGALRVDAPRGLEIEALGAATLHGDPLVLLKLIYAR